MTLRAIDKALSRTPAGRGESVELMEAMKQAFETIAMAKVSMSAFEARDLGFIASADDITMNRERVLTDAKERALELARRRLSRAACRAPISPLPAKAFWPPEAGRAMMRQGDYISDHEVKVGNKVAEVLCGGDVIRARRSASNICWTLSAKRSSRFAARRRRRNVFSTR